MERNALVILAAVGDDIPVKINGEEIGNAYISPVDGNLEIRITEEAAHELFRPTPGDKFGVSVSTEINLSTSEIVEEGATL